MPVTDEALKNYDAAVIAHFAAKQKLEAAELALEQARLALTGTMTVSSTAAVSSTPTASSDLSAAQQIVSFLKSRPSRTAKLEEMYQAVSCNENTLRGTASRLVGEGVLERVEEIQGRPVRGYYRLAGGGR